VRAVAQTNWFEKKKEAGCYSLRAVAEQRAQSGLESVLQKAIRLLLLC